MGRGRAGRGDPLEREEEAGDKPRKPRFFWGGGHDRGKEKGGRLPGPSARSPRLTRAPAAPW